jgi:hypothetical protein
MNADKKSLELALSSNTNLSINEAADKIYSLTNQGITYENSKQIVEQMDETETEPDDEQIVMYQVSGRYKSLLISPT